MVDALEAWASREAASIMVGLFVVAAGVMVLAVPPSLVLGGRRGGRVAPVVEAPSSVRVS